MSDPRSPRVRSAEETILDLHAKIESDAKVIAALVAALAPFAASAYDRDGLPPDWGIGTPLRYLREARAAIAATSEHAELTGSSKYKSGIITVGKSIIAISNVVGTIEVGQRVLGLRVRRSRWAVWRERITTLRWSVPMEESQDGVIVAVATSNAGLNPDK